MDNIIGRVNEKGESKKLRKNQIMPLSLIKTVELHFYYFLDMG